MRYRSGFTLVELLVVITIILAISVIAMPGVINAIQSRQADVAVQILQGSIASARDLAIHSNNLAGLRFLPNPANPNELVKIVPLVPAPDYTDGQVNTFPGEVYPVSVTGGLPCLVLEESPGSWHLVGGKYGWLPNVPTTWGWNIRAGDRVYLAGHAYTVCGPLPQTNAEFLVSGNTLQRTYTAPDGLTSVTLNPEYLLLVNGMDDNGDGFIDNGWDGIDNNQVNGVDDAAEWEVETWTVSQQTSVSYRIVRRPVRGNGQTVDLAVPIDLTQSTLPQNPVDGSVEVMIRPDGSAALTSLHAMPSEPAIAQGGKAVQPALLFVLGTTADHRTVTLWPKTGLMESD